jgi:pimeloyl-ACP methyl ester carboxylesterase
MRSGQQAALARDLLDLLDALAVPRAALVGYDWGGRAACITAALWPKRVRCLVTGDGYNVHDIAAFAIPQSPETEHRNWYQFYFHTPRGQAGLTAYRRELARLLWQLWSPSWRFDDATFAETAASFDNPDFVDVVIHSYRHRYGYAVGDPALEAIEIALARKPQISVPTISLSGGDDGVSPPPAEDTDRLKFSGPYERRVFPGIGHNIPQEAPAATLAALRDLLRA